jgi:hypothetical protein
MAKLKKIQVRAKNKAGAEEVLHVDVNVDADGVFYANIPEHLRLCFDANRFSYSARTPKGFFRASACTYDQLVSSMKAALDRYVEPVVTEEPVIVYNIESHVSFAEDASGNICPNAGFPGARWVNESRNGDSPSYGDHSATHSSAGGYSIKIGARAQLKRTYRFGNKERVEYKNYYADGDHHGNENPAELLNSWCAFHLGDNFKEIPYSDEAALFFHRMQLGIAELNRRIQQATFTQERLTALISSSAGLPLLGVDSRQDHIDGGVL